MIVLILACLVILLIAIVTLRLKSSLILKLKNFYNKHFFFIKIKKKNVSNLTLNDTKTIFILVLIIYLATLPLYHPDTKKNKDNKQIAYEKYQMETNQLYRTKILAKLIEPVVEFNQRNFPNVDDKIFFQFPQRKTARKLKKKILLENKLLIEEQLTNLNLTLEERKILEQELAKITKEIEILVNKQGI